MFSFLLFIVILTVALAVGGKNKEDVKQHFKNSIKKEEIKPNKFDDSDDF